MWREICSWLKWRRGSQQEFAISRDQERLVLTFGSLCSCRHKICLHWHEIVTKYVRLMFWMYCKMLSEYSLVCKLWVKRRRWSLKLSDWAGSNQFYCAVHPEWPKHEHWCTSLPSTPWKLNSLFLMFHQVGQVRLLDCKNGAHMLS